MAQEPRLSWSSENKYVEFSDFVTCLRVTNDFAEETSPWCRTIGATNDKQQLQ